MPILTDVQSVPQEIYIARVGWWDQHPFGQATQQQHLNMNFKTLSLLALTFAATLAYVRAEEDNGQMLASEGENDFAFSAGEENEYAAGEADEE